MPVLHQGYVEFLKKYYPRVEAACILSRQLVEEHTLLEREIRAIDPVMAVEVLESMGYARTFLLTPEYLPTLIGASIIVPDEMLMRRFAEKHLTGSTITFATTFLRWDESHVDSKASVTYDRISEDSFDREMMALARTEGARSSDWWRRVGAVSVHGATILLREHNTHMPSEYSPYALGDIRDFIAAGTRSDISSALHAEQMVITQAASEGIALKGSSIYVSVFPCPTCAKWIAAANIKKCFYGSGHASFDGEKNLKDAGVEIIYVK